MSGRITRRDARPIEPTLLALPMHTVDSTNAVFAAVKRSSETATHPGALFRVVLGGRKLGREDGNYGENGVSSIFRGKRCQFTFSQRNHLTLLNRSDTAFLLDAFAASRSCRSTCAVILRTPQPNLVRGLHRLPAPIDGPVLPAGVVRERPLKLAASPSGLVSASRVSSSISWSGAMALIGYLSPRPYWPRPFALSLRP